MFDLLACADQRGIEHCTFFDLFQQFLAFFDQTFHGRALHAFQLQTSAFHQFIDTIDLTLSFFKMSLEGFCQQWIGRSACQTRECFGNLLFSAVNV